MERFRFRSLKKGWKEEVNEFGEIYFRLCDFERNQTIYGEREINNLLKTFLDPLLLNDYVTKTSIEDSFLFVVFNFLEINVSSQNESGKLFTIRNSDDVILVQTDDALKLLRLFLSKLTEMIEEVSDQFYDDERMKNLLGSISKIISSDKFIDEIGILTSSLKKINSLDRPVSNNIFRLGPYELEFRICETNYISHSLKDEG